MRHKAPPDKRASTPEHISPEHFPFARRRLASFGVKLFLYFLLFAALILGLLWLLQTVFLQQFYVDMKTRDVSRVVNKLIAAYDESGFEKKADSLAYQNSLLLYVTDLSGTIYLTTDEHAALSRGGKAGRGKGKNQNLQLRPLPDGYDAFLSQLQASVDGRVSYLVDTELDASTLVVGALLDESTVLYISAPVDPVDGTISILRTQLLYVTFVALLLGLVLALLISRRFSRPIRRITQQARKLAGGEFPDSFGNGFCSELDELSGTLSAASRELGQVERLRRELIANVSHDLRTPLTMIKAYTEMIRDISGDNREKRARDLSVIADETDRLTALVNDILSLSEAQAGSPLALREVHMGALVRSVLERFSPLLEREGIGIDSSIEERAALGDAQRLTQVLYNLLGNAINYVGEDKRIEVAVRGAGGRVRVSVTDHGAGIPEEERNSIWERYYKARDHKRDVAGTGLGLSIVKGILEQHGAAYGVDSVVGEGSTFWFELEGGGGA